jgi:chromosome segregation ATPase
MIEAIMYFGIGFLVATLLGLLFVPLVHNRAVRLTTKRLEGSTPLSMVEIRADRDYLRAEFAVSTRRLETTIEKLKAKTSTQFAELGKKAGAVNRLNKELAEKKVTNIALEARDRKLRDQLRATEEELRMKSSALLDADSQLAHNQAELARMWAKLGERSLGAT